MMLVLRFVGEETGWGEKRGLSAPKIGGQKPARSEIFLTPAYSDQRPLSPSDAT